MTRLLNDHHLAAILARPGYGVREQNTSSTPDAPLLSPPGKARPSGSSAAQLGTTIKESVRAKRSPNDASEHQHARRTIVTGTTTSRSAGASQDDGVQPSAGATPAAALTLPWPPSGNTGVRHAGGAHYLNPSTIAYRDSVAWLLQKAPGIESGRYRLHVHMSPPDYRERDMDNALKTLFDALKKCGHIHSDSMQYMRELLVTVDDEKLNHVRVRAVAA